jgi:hypothetical protein
MKSLIIQCCQLIFGILILISCGGVVGNIEKYDFSGYKYQEVKNAVERTFIDKPELLYEKIKNDSINGLYYCVLDNGSGKEVYKLKVIDAIPPYDSTVQIALVSVAEYGEVMYLAKNISYLKKRKFKKTFEENYLTLIRHRLKR